MKRCVGLGPLSVLQKGILCLFHPQQTFCISVLHKDRQPFLYLHSTWYLSHVWIYWVLNWMNMSIYWNMYSLDSLRWIDRLEPTLGCISNHLCAMICAGQGDVDPCSQRRWMGGGRLVAFGGNHAEDWRLSCRRHAGAGLPGCWRWLDRLLCESGVVELLGHKVCSKGLVFLVRKFTWAISDNI